MKKIVDYCNEDRMQISNKSYYDRCVLVELEGKKVMNVVIFRSEQNALGYVKDELVSKYGAHGHDADIYEMIADAEKTNEVGHSIYKFKNVTFVLYSDCKNVEFEK